jgi:uncharacterized protein YegL
MTNRTLVTFLLDRSGSMESIKNDTIGAFNAYLDGMKSEETIEFTLVQFDSQGLDKICVATPIEQAPALSRDNFQPRGATPLIDAAYKTIKAVETSLNGDAETKVVICIQTDGEENASVEHSWADLNALIKEKTDLGWQFNFLGAGIDAYQQGVRMGIAQSATMSYNSSDRVMTEAAFKGRAMRTSLYASGAVADMSIDAGEKLAAGDRFDRKVAPPITAQAPAANNTKRKPLVDNFTL